MNNYPTQTKISNLDISTNNHNNIHYNNWFKNISSIEILNEIMDIVALGPKFNLKVVPSEKDIIDVIKNLEKSLQHIEYNNKVSNDISVNNNNNNKDIKKFTDSIRRDAVHSLKNATKNTKHVSLQDKWLIYRVKSVKKFLKNNKNIFFTYADKGNVTICID